MVQRITYTSGMARMVGRGALVGMSLAANLLGGCSSTMPPASEMTGMHFSTATTLASNPPPAVDVSVGEVPAQNVYALTLALPDFPEGTFNCPIDFGVVYTLTFFNGDAIAVTASLNPGGCRDVRISGSTPVRRVLDDSYWSSLAQQVGVPESMIYPYIPPGL
jgi:hypothetical protein